MHTWAFLQLPFSRPLCGVGPISVSKGALPSSLWIWFTAGAHLGHLPRERHIGQRQRLSASVKGCRQTERNLTCTRRRRLLTCMLVAAASRPACHWSQAHRERDCFIYKSDINLRQLRTLFDGQLIPESGFGVYKGRATRPPHSCSKFFLPSLPYMLVLRSRLFRAAGEGRPSFAEACGRGDWTADLPLAGGSSCQRYVQ